jgi:hypothetical protein
MKTTLSEFLVEDNNPLEQYSFIKTIGGKLSIKNAKSWEYPKSLFNENYTELNYSTLMRFLLLAWIYKYKGDNKELNYIKDNLINYDAAATREFDHIPTNYTILNKYIKPIVKDDLSTKTTNVSILIKILENKDVIFTEDNILKWYHNIIEITKIATNSEEGILNIFKDKNIFSDFTKPTVIEDRSGIDWWATNKNNEIVPIQVKSPSVETEINMYWGKDYYEKDGVKITKQPDYLISIKNTNLDMKNYNSSKDGKLKYKFLMLYDFKNKKLYQINTSSINFIKRNEEKNNIIIVMGLDEKWLPKMIKTYDL